MTSSISNQPDVLEVVGWLKQLEDPVARLASATEHVDKARDELLPELAGIRRTAAMQARKVLTAPHEPDKCPGLDQQCAVGHQVTEANQIMAQVSGMSPQTVVRLIAEYRQYGGE